jgi:hypothetical protein
MDAPRDIYDGGQWSEMDIEDLKGAVGVRQLAPGDRRVPLPLRHAARRRRRRKLGRLSSASAPFPVSASTNSRTIKPTPPP